MLPWIIVSQHRRLVLRISLLFRASPCESFRLLRNDTDSGISYPNQHIDSECLLRTCYFRASLHYDTLRRQCFSSSIDGRAIRLPSEGMHYEHFMSSLFLQNIACCLGSYRSRIPDIPCRRLVFVISYGKAVPFPGRTLRRRFFVVSRRFASLSRIEGIRRHILTMEKFCWLVSHIDGVLEGQLPFSYEPLRKEA